MGNARRFEYNDAIMLLISDTHQQESIENRKCGLLEGIHDTWELYLWFPIWMTDRPLKQTNRSYVISHISFY